MGTYQVKENVVHKNLNKGNMKSLFFGPHNIKRALNIIIAQIRMSWYFAVSAIK